MKKTTIVSVLCLLVLCSCATQPEPYITNNLPGFFTGLWHGWVSIFAFFGHLFDNSIKIYEFPNNGGWYEFGFMIGVGGVGGILFRFKE
jgi:hypothetical protein